MSNSSEDRWADALAAMNSQERAAVTDLRNRFAQLGADDPEGWALSEVSESIPQMARFLALRRIWPEMIDSWSAPEALETLPAAARLLAAGADRDDLTTVARSAAYEALFALLYRLTAHGCDDEGPGWGLMETTPAGEPTGRWVGALHEDLLSLDPSGQEGEDLFR